VWVKLFKNLQLPILIICFALIILISMAIPKKAYALAWYENIMSDSAFINESSMSVAQIQSFLVSHGSYLANYTIPSKDYVSNCPTQEGAGQKASAFIHHVAHEVGINPQVILVTMEKEESLISTNYQWNTHLQWAMGYGYYSGSRLIDPGNCDLYVGGFGRQVYWGAKFYRNRYNNVGGLQGPGTSHAGDTISIQNYSDRPGNINIYLSNRTTALLYRYTPYVHYGNYNFYTLMNRWFAGGLPANASPANYNFGAISDTTIRKIAGLGGKTYYYLVHGTNRYSFGSNTILVSHFGHNYTTAQTITQENLNALNNQGILKYYILSPNGTDYFIAGGLKYKIYPSSVINRRWGFNNIEPFSMPADLVSAIPSAPVEYLAGYIRGSSNSNTFFIDRGGAKYLVWPSAAFKARWDLRTTDLVVLPQPVVDRMFVPNKKYLTGLVKSVSGKQLYYIDKGIRYPVWPSSIFYARWGFNNSDVSTLSAEQLSSMTKTKWLNGLVRTSKTNPIYYIDNYGKRFRIPIGPSIWNNWKFSLGAVSIISPEQLSSLPYKGYLKRNVRGHRYSTTCKMTSGRCLRSGNLSSPSIISQAQFYLLPK
jgi:hypothetical protein